MRPIIALCGSPGKKEKQHKARGIPLQSCVDYPKCETPGSKYKAQVFQWTMSSDLATRVEGTVI